MKTNREMPLRNLDRISGLVGKRPEHMKMLMLGVSYRSEVEDTRYSASEIFYRQACDLGIQVDLHDPHVKFWREVNRTIESELPSTDGFDVIVFAVAHKQYRELDLGIWLCQWDGLVYDCNNVLTKSQIGQLEKNGVNFHSTGRG